MLKPVGEEMIALLPRLRRFAVSLTGSPVFADDLVQGACERALTAASRLATDTRFDAWMFRILRNLWIDSLRRRRTEGQMADVTEHHELVGSEGYREVEARLTLKRVRSAIAELPPEQREVLVLVCIEDMSYRATAEMLGVPIGTVMSRLSRARQRLSELTGEGRQESESGREGA